jgi:hypothetical protein
MLGRKILKRITRLGLSFYATLWCMSFTVCAYDNPLADMAVSNRIDAYAEDSSDLSSALNEGAQLPENVETQEDAGLAVQEETVLPDVTDPGGDDYDVTEPEPLGEDDQETEGQPDNEGDVLPSDAQNTEDTEEPGEDVLPEDTEENDEIDEDVIEVLENETEDLITDAEEIDDDELLMADEVDGFFLSVRSAARDWSSEYYNMSREYEYGFVCTGDIKESFDEVNASEKTEFRAVKDKSDIETGFNATDNQYGGICFTHGNYQIDAFGSKIQFVKAYFNQDWRQSNGDEFYIVGRYQVGDKYYYSEPYHVDIYIPVYNTVMYIDNGTGWDSDTAIKRVIDTENDTEAIEKFSEKLFFNVTEYSTLELSADRISWSVMEEREDGNYTVNERRGIVVTPVDDTNQTVEVTLNQNFTESGHFVIQARYNNNFILSNGTERRPRFESSFASAVMDIEYYLPPREAHLSEPAIKMQIFNSTNVVPVTIRIENESLSQSFGYKIIGVEFADPALDKYLEIAPYGDKSVNLKAKYDLVNMDSKALAKFVKNKYSTKLNITAKVNGIPEILTTKENLTITFGNKLPTAKDLKYNNTLTFNSFYAGQDKAYLVFDRPYISKVVAEDPAKLKTMGFEVDENGVVRTLNDTLPAAKKGSFNVNATISDSAGYNLPENFTIKTKVNYVVKNEAPVIYELTTNNVLLNGRLNENCTIGFEVKDGYDSSVNIAYKVLDKNNKELSVNPLKTSCYYYSWGEGRLIIGCLNDTAAGQTYKISLYPVNRNNNRTGAAKVITVKTVAEKNQLNPSITAKGKGSIDACNPYSYLNISLTARNCNLFGKEMSLNVRLENNTDITEFFDYDYSYENNVLYVYQNTTETEFPLLEKGYAGQKITITAGFNLTGGSELYNLTYSTKIGASKVTPKLKTKSITINPDYYSGQSIYVMLTDSYPYPWLYKYDCVIDFGKDKSGNNFTHPFNATSYYDEIVIDSSTSDLSSLVGKTGTLKITPKLPGANPGTATCKITILNPAKSKASMTLKAKGSIDAIKNPYDSYVNITTSFKNVGYTDASYVDVKCINITTMVNGKEVSVNHLFNNDTYSRNVIRIRRKADENLTAGTYKAYIQARYRSEPLLTAGINGTGVFQIGGIIEKTVTFKVTRGKAGTSFTPSPIKLINRDYTRYADVEIVTKTKGVAGISRVEIVDAKYNDKLKISRKYGNTCQLEFANNFYETSKAGKLILAITKSVTKTVKVNVYYKGSEVPEKVNLKVKITP